MKTPGAAPVEVSTRGRAEIIDKWRALLAATYPPESARLLLEDSDPFQNPLGRVFREGLPVIFDELVGGMDAARVRGALEEMVRVRAVQELRASEAIGFLFQLKTVVREVLRPDTATVAVLDERIDEMILTAFDLYVECREKIGEIRVNAAKRRIFVLEKMAAGR